MIKRLSADSGSREDNRPYDSGRAVVILIFYDQLIVLDSERGVFNHVHANETPVVR